MYKKVGGKVPTTKNVSISSNDALSGRGQPQGHNDAGSISPSISRAKL